MEVTQVKITKYEKGTMLAFVEIQFDHCMLVKGWKLFRGRDGNEFDLGFPSEPDKKGLLDDNGKLKYWPFVRIDTKNGEQGKKLLAHIKDTVFAKYRSSGNSQNSQPSNDAGQEWPDQDRVPF